MGDVIRYDFRAKQRLTGETPSFDDDSASMRQRVADYVEGFRSVLPQEKMIALAAQSIVALETVMSAEEDTFTDPEIDICYRLMHETLMGLNEDAQQQAWGQAYETLGIRGC